MTDVIDLAERRKPAEAPAEQPRIEQYRWWRRRVTELRRLVRESHRP